MDDKQSDAEAKARRVPDNQAGPGGLPESYTVT